MGALLAVRRVEFLMLYICDLFVDLQIYCCIGLLSIAGRLHHVDVDTLGWWLCERQLPSGGLNGQFSCSLCLNKKFPR